MASEIAGAHHERWDGNGYVAGLVGAEIPLAGRITALADVWDTLTHERPYKPAWDEDRALAEIHSQAGAHFDPASSGPSARSISVSSTSRWPTISPSASPEPRGSGPRRGPRRAHAHSTWATGPGESDSLRSAEGARATKRSTAVNGRGSSSACTKGATTGDQSPATGAGDAGCCCAKTSSIDVPTRPSAARSSLKSWGLVAAARAFARDMTGLHVGEQCLIEGLHPVEGPFGDDGRQQGCLVRVHDRVADATGGPQDLQRGDAAAVHGRDQTLRDHPAERRGEHRANLTVLVGREEVDDTVDRLGRVGGMERGKHQVSGLGRGESGADGLLVAHLTDEDDVGVRRSTRRRARPNEPASDPTSRWLMTERLSA